MLRRTDGALYGLSVDATLDVLGRARLLREHLRHSDQLLSSRRDQQRDHASTISVICIKGFFLTITNIQKYTGSCHDFRVVLSVVPVSLLSTTLLEACEQVSSDLGLGGDPYWVLCFLPLYIT